MKAVTTQRWRLFLSSRSHARRFEQMLRVLKIDEKRIQIGNAKFCALVREQYAKLLVP